MITTTNPPKQPVTPLVKVSEVAKLLSVSNATVHNLIECGDLTASEIFPAVKKRERIHLRVTRDSLLVFYKKRFGHSLDRALAHSFDPSAISHP
jgi:hypothetical protein